MADYQITYNGIAVGPDGRISIDGDDAFREASAEGDVYDVYAIVASYGSNYGVVGTGYHGHPQSWSGWISDAWATLDSGFEFSPGNPVYNSVKVDLAQAYADFVSKHHRMPTTADVFQMHEDIFAQNGIPGAWMGSTIPGMVLLGIGIEPCDPMNTDPFPETDAMGNPTGHCFSAHSPIAISATQTKPIEDIRLGDTVLAFDPAADLGRGALVPRKVVRLFRNTTEEWVKLSWAEGGAQEELITTPGHHFLDRFGNFQNCYR